MKKNIALIAGGYSREHEISLLSAANVEKQINTALYNCYKIIITKNEWICDGMGKIDKNDFSLQTPQGKIHFDAAYIMIHGSPGENGLLQGYFDMLGIPYTTCSAAVSALTFDKGLCNKVIGNIGIRTAPSLYLHKSDAITNEFILSELNLPVFVKPAAGGSSFGVSKVKKKEELLNAVEAALKEDSSVLIEENINGREITCGVFRYKGNLHVFPPTEVVSENEYFDYEAKYQGKSKEITPAPLPEDLIIRCQSLSALIYKRLNCSGVVRIDYILSEDEFIFLEINTVPGMSGASIIPQQIAEYGWTSFEFCNKIIEDTLFRAGQ